MRKEEIIYKRVDDLIPYIHNPRQHGDTSIDAIASSIKNFGFKVPVVVDSNNEIINGHGRILAAKKLGIEEVPVIYADDLTADQIKAFRLADNKIQELSAWDEELMNLALEELNELENLEFSMEEFGFDELEELVSQEVVEDDFDVEVPEEPKSKLGDIYQLGRHRLMCGDSTKPEDVGKLMGGAIADMTFTDPPYNIGYQGVIDKRTIKNEKMNDKLFLNFLESSIYACDTAYVCCSWQNANLFKEAMINLGMKPKAMIVWNKVNPAQNLDKYFKQHELIFYYGKFGGGKDSSWRYLGSQEAIEYHSSNNEAT